MPDLVETAGSASANSFVSVGDGDTYCDARLNASAWKTNENQKIRALIEATRELSVLNWIGRRTANTQALSWPRQWAPNPDDPYLLWFNTSEIPQRVKDATCELALQFLIAGTSDLAGQERTVGITEESVDVITTKYAEPYLRPVGLQRFPRIMAMLTPLLATNGSTIPLVRG